jgi:hypothetical protein
MRLRSRSTRPTDPQPTAHSQRSLVASAARIKLDGTGWRTYRFGDDTWQQEAWRLYDIVGELRFVANWIGAACSRVRIYVAQVDDNGRVQKEVTTKKIAGLADTLFGGPAAKAEALRMLGINLTVAGDCFIVGRGTDDPKSDEWFVVSTSELKRWGGRVWQINPEDDSREELNPRSDLVIRVWTPHPRRHMWADSPCRAAMPMLWEIERLTRFVFAQIDSRLVSAGIFPLPKEASFPDEVDEDGNMLTGSEALTQRLMRTASASLKGEGTAAGVVPIFMETPGDTLGKFQLVEFTSELSRQALELRSEAIRRFALAMDIEPSILSGMGEANHWGAWQIMEGQINVHIVPLMSRICDALTAAYLKPALKAVGEKDEERFVFWYDTAPLTVRPERLEDTLGLYDKSLVSRETVLLSGDYKISDAPSVEEEMMLFTRELMLRDPNLFQIPAVRKVAGYTDDLLPPNTVVTPQQPGQPGAGPPPPPPPPTGIQPTPGGPMPLESVAQNNPAGPPPVPGAPGAVAASATVPTAVHTFVVSNAAVLRALERAGKRLLDRHSRDRWPDVPAYELHTRIRVGGADHAERLLEGAWDHLPVLVAALDHHVDTGSLEESLQHYCMTLLVQEQPHDVKLLGQYLTNQGLI